MGDLTDKAIQAALKRAKAAGKMGRLSAGHQLTLLITPEGVGRWQQRYSFGSKFRTVSFGSYPAVSLAEATAKSIAARDLLRSGTDPVEHRRAQKAELRRVVENTFGAAAESWYEFNQPRWTKSTAEKARQYLDKDILPSLRLRPITKVTSQDLGDMVAKVESRKAFNVAKKVRQWCSSIFKYSIARGLTRDNPAENLGAVAAPAPEPKNYAHLELGELPELLRALDGYSGSLLTVGAIRLALWTANRPGVTRTLKWDELDLDNAVWTIKKGREGMKKGYSHLTPLPRQAVAMLRDLHKISGTFEHVFIGRGDPLQPMSNMAVNKALEKMGFKGRQTAHGFRHLISTAMNERGYKADWVERQLSHGDPDKIRGTYNKAMYLEPRRKMMQQWADLVDSLKRGNVFPMPGRAAQV
jgi:integrase